MQAATVEEVETKNQQLNELVCSLQNQISFLQEQLEWFKRQVFGQRTERMVDLVDEKQLCFEGFELSGLPVEEKSVTVHKRKAPKQKSQDKISLPPDLPVEQVVIDLPEEKRVCPETGKPLVKIGEERSLKLAYRPASYFLKEIIRPKYALPEGGVATAEMPDSIISRCRADESLLAEILVKKYADHLPLYRICEVFSREGIGISRQLLSQWVIRLAEGLYPLYQEMRKKVLESGNVFMDESPVLLQAQKKCQQSYMWVIAGGNGADPPYRVYDFRTNRQHKNVFDMLATYTGNLHSDKYGAYETIAQREKIIWCPCWSHVRRKFVEAESGDPKLREWILRKIRYLFMFERVAWARSEPERLRIRKEKEAPIVKEIRAKIAEVLEEGSVLPRSKLGEALKYTYGLGSNLENYLTQAYARLDNNVAERALRPLALGRKNWLFMGSVAGGRAAAVLLSLVQTCRGLGINPRNYLEDVMRRLMSHPANKIRELLPDAWAAAQKDS